MSRTSTAELCAPRTSLNTDDYLDRQATLAARESGQFQPGTLAHAMDWHPSNGSRAMSGCPHGGRWFNNVLGGLFRLATHPQTDAWPVLARGQIVVKRAEISTASTQELRRDFWRHMDGRRQAEQDAADALLERNSRKFAEAEARRSADASAIAAHLDELLCRRVDPLAEGRTP